MRSLWILTILLGSLPSAVAAQEEILTPGHEAKLGRLIFAEAGPRADLTARWKIASASILATHVVVRLSDGAHQGVVELHRPDSHVAGRSLGKTASFSVWLTGGGEEPECRHAADVLFARVSARDQGAFFAPRGAGTVRGSGSRPARWAIHTGTLRTFDTWRRRGNWVGLLLLLTALAILLARHGPRPKWAVVLAVLALFALALLVRLVIPPWAPLHTNCHGISELRGLCGATSNFPSEATRYGEGYWATSRALLGLFGTAGNGPLVLNALLGALSVAVLFWIGATVFRGRYLVASVAALGLALHPAHVRVSLSESHTAMAGLLFLVGIAAGLSAIDAAHSKPVRHVSAWLAGTALAAACELRVLTLALPVAAALFVLCMLRSRLRAAVGVFVGPGLWVALAAGLHRLALAPVLADAGGHARGWDSLLSIAGPANLLLRPELTSLLVLPLAAAGVWSLCARRECRPVAAVLTSTGLLLGLSFVICADRTDAIRYQTGSHLLLFLLPAALGTARLGRLSPHTVSVIVGAGLLLTSIPGLAGGARPSLEEAAYLIAAHDAPKDAEVIVIGPRRLPPGIVLNEFPDYLLPRPEIVAESASPPGGRCYVYVGPQCWSFARGRREPSTLIDGQPFRSDCVSWLGGEASARRVVSSLAPVPVRHRDWLYHAVPARTPRVGYAPCEATGLPR